MTHAEMRDLIPLYALDALPDDEDFELRMHVEACPECALILKDHLETAGALAASVDPLVPSAELKQKLFEQVRSFAAADDLQRRRAPWGRRWLPAAAVAAFVAVASLSAVLVRRIDTQQQQIEEQRRLLALVSSPGVQAVSLKSGPVSSAASGRVFVDPAKDVSGLVFSGLSEPGEGVYALWLIESGKPRLIENFSPDASGAAVILLPREVGGNRTVAVTLEPRPDTPAPQGPVVLSA